MVMTTLTTAKRTSRVEFTYTTGADIARLVCDGILDALTIVNAKLKEIMAENHELALYVTRARGLFSNSFDHLVVYDTVSDSKVCIIQDKHPKVR